MAEFWSALALILRVLIGALLIVAACAKLWRGQNALQQAVMAYQLLPSVLVKPFSLALPVIEIVAGLSLIVALHAEWPLLLAACLLAVFIIAILRSVLLDRKHYCGGCWGFSTHDVSIVRWQLVYRNSVFVILLAVADLIQGGPWSHVLVAASLLCLAVVATCHAFKRYGYSLKETWRQLMDRGRSSGSAELQAATNHEGDAR
jgi:uncharacterized membrane protein YphA (DoxX/SURF4 family)